MVQLHPLVPTRYVYLQQHNAVVGGIWWRHHNQFADLIAKYAPRDVVEIGGGHGYLATKLLLADQVKRWTMVDPNPDHLFQLPMLKIIKGFFGDVHELPPTVDAVVHSHTLEHIYEPVGFFAQLQRLLTIGSYHIFSTPDMLRLAQNDAPTLHFEHSLLMREEWIEWLLSAHGFELIERSYFSSGTLREPHSIFYVARLTSKSHRPLPW
jgi:Spermidine synthase